MRVLLFILDGGEFLVGVIWLVTEECYEDPGLRMTSHRELAAEAPPLITWLINLIINNKDPPKMAVISHCLFHT